MGRLYLKPSKISEVEIIITDSIRGYSLIMDHQGNKAAILPGSVTRRGVLGTYLRDKSFYPDETFPDRGGDL